MPMAPIHTLLSRISAAVRLTGNRALGDGSVSLAERLSNPARHGSEDLAAQLRARQVDAIQRLGVPLMVANIVNAAALVLELLLTGQLTPLAAIWSALAVILALMLLMRAWRRRGMPAPQRTSRRTLRRVVQSAALFGVLWSVPGLLILPGLTGMALAFGAALLTGMIAGGAIVLYPIPAAATVFFVPVTLSAVAGLALSHGWLALGPGLLAAAFLYVFLGVLRRHSDLFVSEFLARLDLEQRNRLIEDLLEDARLEVLGARRIADARPAARSEGEVTGQIAAGIAHFFNNMLAVIQGNAELLREEGRSDDKLIVPILESCYRGGALVRRLRAAGQKQDLTPEPVTLAPVVGRLVRAFELTAGPKISVEATLPPALWPACTDAAQLEAALFELMRNACEAMPEGGRLLITGRNAPGAIRMPGPRRARARDAVAITVGDSGGGMDAATRARAAEPFFSTKPAGTASGLGLSTVAGFVRQSGGDLLVESRPGAGSAVTLCLPRHCPEGRRPARAEGAGAAPLVLVVDPDPATREAARAMLGETGFRVLSAADEAEALQATAGPDRVDAVLIDLMLSGAPTGMQLGRALQRMYPTLPVAFMSDLSRGAGLDGAAEGARAVLAKPLDRERLTRHLEAALTQTDAIVNAR